MSDGCFDELVDQAGFPGAGSPCVSALLEPSRAAAWASTSASQPAKSCLVRAAWVIASMAGGYSRAGCRLR